MRRWVAHAEVDAGGRPGVTSDELEEIKRLEAENRRLREDMDGHLEGSDVFLRG